MFRLLRLNPPNGWSAVAWELAIVTIGVLIALAAQHWAESRSWQGKADASKAALREELALHYHFAVEFRVVYPCLQAQLDVLRERVLSSGETLDPAPVHHERGTYVLRIPAKFYPSDVWAEAIGDGIVQHFDPEFRRRLAENYASLETISALNAASTEDEQSLMVLSHPLPLDSSTRYSIVREIELMSSRFRYLDLLNGQLIDSVEHLGMVPPAEDSQSVTERYGTYHFCKGRDLPMRSFKEAMQSIPN